MAQSTSIGEKIERAAKVVGAFVAICGAVMGVFSWIFTTTMASRDRHIERLSSEIISLKSELADSSSKTGEKLDSLSSDVIRLKIAIIASRVESGMRAAEVDLLASTSNSNRRRPRQGSSLMRRGDDPLQGIDDIMSYAMPDRESEYVAQLQQSVVDVDGDNIVIDDPETAMTVFNEAISQVEAEPLAPPEALVETVTEPTQQE